MSRHPGSITLLMGPMFSGKTAELILRVKRAAHAGIDVLVVKHSHDTRYTGGDALVTHAGDTLEDGWGGLKGKVRVISVCGLDDVDAKPTEQIIAVDEGQFFSGLVDWCDSQADAGKQIIIAALDGDFARRPFGEVCSLIPKCEKVTKLNGICVKCFGVSSFSKRVSGGEDIIEVGADDKYQPMCRECYHS